MMEKEVFDNLMKNSIGKEKKVKKNFDIRNVVLKTSATVIASVIIATSLAGCSIFDKNNPESKAISQMNEISDNYSFDLSDVRIYERKRLYELLDANGIDNYEEAFGRRRYSCTSEDYSKVKGLDESYLYAIYFTHKTKDQADEMAKALGYDSLDDYLLKNNYVDVRGNISYDYWLADDAIIMAKMLDGNGSSKGVSK